MRSYSRRLTMAIVKVDEIEHSLDQSNPINDSELCLMYALDDGVPHSQKEIAESWGISRTTLNTIVKQWEKDGLLTLAKISGKRREMQICLTEVGIKKVRSALKATYAAEDKAMRETVEKYSSGFIEALEYYAKMLESSANTDAHESE